MDNIKIELDGKAISTADFYKHIINNSVQVFNDLTEWKASDFKEYKILLDKLKELNGAKEVKTTDKGLALEELVKFIISSWKC